MRALAVAVVASWLVGVASAAPQKFGERTLEIPAPAGFVGISSTQPGVMKAAQAALPLTNRLVEQYVTVADKAKLDKGEMVALDHRFQLQVLRETEGKIFTREEFAVAIAQVEKELGNATAMIKEANDGVKQRTGVDPKVDTSSDAAPKILRREPEVLVFSMNMKADNRDITIASGILIANHQALYCYAFAPVAERATAEAALGRWVDQVRAANPTDQPRAPSTGSPASTGVHSAGVLLGAIIGGLLAVILIRQRKKAR